MGYYMRLIVDDARGVSFGEIETSLRQTDSDYKIDRDEEDDKEGVLMYGGEDFAHININKAGGGILEDDVDMLKEFVERNEGENKTRVLEVLDAADTIFFVRVLDGGRESEATLKKIDPIWKWFFNNRRGLLQADAEGYYDASGLIFEVK